LVRTGAKITKKSAWATPQHAGWVYRVASQSRGHTKDEDAQSRRKPDLSTTLQMTYITVVDGVHKDTVIAGIHELTGGE
jgi:hypothetical protein